MLLWRQTLPERASTSAIGLILVIINNCLKIVVNNLLLVLYSALLSNCGAKVGQIFEVSK